MSNITPELVIDEQTRLPLSKWRKEIKTLNHSKCLYCGASDGGTYKTRLESHHIFSRALYPELTNSLENGVCLCHSCHRILHGSSHCGMYLEDSSGIVATTASSIECVILQHVQTSILISLPPGEYAVLKAYAESRGESVNAFINRAIDETMEREKTP